MGLGFGLGKLLIIGLLLAAFSGNILAVRSEVELKPAGYIGNKESLKFHRPDCPFAQMMAKFRRQYFCNRKVASEAGMKACRYCLPGIRLRVKARLLHAP